MFLWLQKYRRVESNQASQTSIEQHHTHIRNINTYVDRYLSGGSGQGIETFFTHTQTQTTKNTYTHMEML